eukprot:TRINITY_DN3495_c0_g2_i1.p1 TRINITY_DN3495_c0_g2~~TRINITY_DN3495_c0_g2_i1.p1  ORF type:complete len:105 (+),score=7.49 TRINITY_DN3495_c0_g2_i1:742-1056(+)
MKWSTGKQCTLKFFPLGQEKLVERLFTSNSMEAMQLTKTNWAGSMGFQILRTSVKRDCRVFFKAKQGTLLRLNEQVEQGFFSMRGEERDNQISPSSKGGKGAGK